MVFLNHHWKPRAAIDPLAVYPVFRNDKSFYPELFRTYFCAAKLIPLFDIFLNGTLLAIFVLFLVMILNQVSEDDQLPGEADVEVKSLPSLEARVTNIAIKTKVLTVRDTSVSGVIRLSVDHLDVY